MTSKRLTVELTWTGDGMRFTGRGTDPESPAVTIDGDGEAGPSPMQALLLAVAGCSGADVVDVLGKMRVSLTALSVEVTGTRAEQHPKRYAAISFRYRMEGEGLEREKAERAVGLSLDKYCSVVHSLAGDIDVSHEIELA